MYISKIHLVNIRSFIDTEIEFSRSINLLIGHNNSGKSTIIKSMYLLAKSQSLNLDDVRKFSAYGKVLIDINDIREEDKKAFTAKKDWSFVLSPRFNSAKVIHGLFKNTLSDSYQAHFFNNNLAYEYLDNYRIRLFDESGDETNPSEFSSFPTKEDDNTFIYPFFANRKSKYYDTQSGRLYANDVGEDLSNITHKIQNLSNDSHPRHNEFVRNVKNILGFKIGTIPQPDNHFNTGSFVSSNETISIQNMGEGVVNILGLIVMLLTEDNKLYLIEELENDIHPKALKQLLELILAKSHNNQFIISTHSNIVLKYLGTESSKIFELQWQPSKDETDRNPTTTIEAVENTPESRMRLLENLGYDTFDFELYKAYLIFEESSAERIVRDFLIPTFIPKLVDKVRTIAASGADDLTARFSDFLRLFVFLHQTPLYKSKAWVIADGDEAGIKNIEKLKEKFTTWNEEHFIALPKSNIEEFYPSQFQEEFSKIISIKDKKEKHQQKIYFNKKVMDWIYENPDGAKEQFANSAKELIDILTAIKDKVI